MPTYKDINLLTQKAIMAGTEKLPVSDTEYISPNQIVEETDQKLIKLEVDIHGSVSIKKDYRWVTGLVVNWQGTVISSGGNMICQPILFRAGERILYKSATSIVNGVVKVADNTQLVEGSSDFIVEKLIDSQTQNVEYSYLFEEDSWVVISISNSNYSISANRSEDGSVDERILDISADVTENSFSGSYSQGGYPTTSVPIGFGAIAGQKIVITTSTTGSLGYGWFIDGVSLDGTTTTIVSRYSATTKYEVLLNADYKELRFRMASGNSGTATIEVTLVNWRKTVNDKILNLENSIGDIETLLAAI